MAFGPNGESGSRTERRSVRISVGGEAATGGVKRRYHNRKVDIVEELGMIFDRVAGGEEDDHLTGG